MQGILKVYTKDQYIFVKIVDKKAICSVIKKIILDPKHKTGNVGELAGKVCSQTHRC